MIRTSELHGMAAIDVDAASTIGHIDEIFLDLDRRSIAALSLSQGGSLLTGDERVIIPATAAHSIGEDAVMVRYPGRSAGGMELFTRASTLAGRAIVTETGTHLGKLDDVLFDEETGHIVGYAFGERDDKPDLAHLFNLRRHRDRDDPVVDYVRADADVRIGDLIVVPDSAVVRGHDLRGARYDPVTHTSTASTVAPATEIVEPAGPSVVRAPRADEIAPVDATVAAPASPASRATARTWRPTNTKWGQGAR